MTIRQPAITPATLPVLLIEDEAAVRATVRAALERSPYLVVPTESGAQGLRLLASEQFPGVVSDMRTPGGVDGAAVRTLLRRNRPDMATRSVFITGDIANQETVAMPRQTGRPSAGKPFRVQPFISLIENTIGKACE
jgi:DNA-binding NtrC family response regulator